MNPQFQKLLPITDQKLPWKQVEQVSLADIDLLDDFYQDERVEFDARNLEHQMKLVDLASNNGIYQTYGGLGEDRYDLWKALDDPGARKTKHMIHLGVDFNNLLPHQQVVQSLSEGKVVHVMRDPSSRNGWGGRVLIKSGNLYFLYGHLAQNEQLPNVDQLIHQGQCIGVIGDPVENGGWFPHLHLQVMHESFVKKFSSNLDLLDGYVFENDLQSMAGVLDPMSFL